MNRPETTKWLSKLLEEHIDPKNDPRVYWAKEITFDYGSVSPIRVDYMQFKPVNNSVSGIEKGDVYCYEIKSSVEDFHSKNGHNLIGDFNYYVMPLEVYEKVMDEIPYSVGVMHKAEYLNLQKSKEKRPDAATLRNAPDDVAQLQAGNCKSEKGSEWK